MSELSRQWLLWAPRVLATVVCAFSSLFAALTVSPQVLDDFFAGKYSLSDFIKHGEPDYTTPRAAQA